MRVRWLCVCLSIAATFVASSSVRGVVSADQPEPRSLKITQPMTVPRFLEELSKEVPGVFTWSPTDRSLATATLPLGTYPLERKRLIRMLRAYLRPYDIILVASGEAPNQTYWVTDMRAKLEPGQPRLMPEPVVIGSSNLEDLQREEGRFVSTRIEAPGLENLEAVKRVLMVVTTHENVSTVAVVRDARAFDVTDFAPNVVLVYRLVQELAALQAASKK